MRILIAEDDLTSRIVLMNILKKQGHDVVATVNGAEAWEAMQKPDAPRMVILDWMMPELSGLDVCRRARAVQTDQPPYLIMLTTKGDKADLIAGLDAGADDYLAKPFDAGELRARINVGVRMLEIQATVAAKVLALQAALADIRTLRGLIPICASCKKIRDDQGIWKQIEVYIHEHTEAEFSHGVCTECMKKLYPDLVRDDQGASE